MVNLAMELKDILAGIGVGASIIIFLLQQRRAYQAVRQESYVRLELASNDVFRFECQYADIIEKSIKFPSKLTKIEERISLNYYTQVLNLLEVATTLRKEGTLHAEVYNSWLAWIYEFAGSKWVTTNWPELCNHYMKTLCDLVNIALQNHVQGLSFSDFKVSASSYWKERS